MFTFSYGDWMRSAQDPNAMPVITLPTDFATEGYVGSNNADNCWLVVSAPEAGTGKFGVFSIDKNLVKGSTVDEVHSRIYKLWQTDKSAFLYQHFLSFIYTAHVKGENILYVLEIIFEELYLKRQNKDKKP